MDMLLYSLGGSYWMFYKLFMKFILIKIIYLYVIIFSYKLNY